MTYQVLARKWRPQVFDAVVGQDPVTRTLRNALASGRVAHAYLFTGPRGVGKTTTARLLAKALACTARTGTEACGACPSCQDFTSGAPVDVLTGFVRSGGDAMGRPVGVAIDARGALLVADDVGNAVWRVTVR